MAHTPDDGTKFDAQGEVVAQLKLLTPAQQQQIIGQWDPALAKCLKNKIHVDSAFTACYRKRVTNWTLITLKKE